MTFPDPETRPLLRPEELIPFIPQMKRSALYEAISRGEIPSLKIGRRLYVPTAAVRRAWSLTAADDPGTVDVIRDGTEDESSTVDRPKTVAA